MDFADAPADVRRTVDRYLGTVDRLLPGRVTGFYLVGSVALGAYREGRSDIDFVAVLDGDTIVTGDAISKEAAGEWAKDTLDPRHHPIVDEGLAWWRGQPADPAFADVATRARATADLVLAAADAAACT